MILILGTSSYEQGTNPVLDWLIYLKADFIKLTIEDVFINFEDINVDINNQQLSYNNISLNESVNVVWYRHFMKPQQFVSSEDSKFYSKLNKELHSEVKFFTQFMYECLKDKKWVSSYPSIYLNKLTVLNHAEKYGIRVPSSKILNTKKHAAQFLEECTSESLIVKQFSDHSRGYYVDNDTSYFSFAKALKNDDIATLATSFFPTLFQEKIDTDYEIRVFYIDGQFYASAILCDAGYNTDDRKKIMSQSNIHHVAYELPEILKQQLTRLMNTIDLAMGAIDLIKSKSGKYYFLEVNPIGQYLYESEKCNLHIAKNIAEYLIKQDKKEVTLTPV
ncbi:hypothetical protein IMCC3317_22540 [Kordia antarctica]|uniref:ATP-grasp domain-containing protein n=1 Tax=Kordia antarctica TaxID=1218801 RepID=A0A7L4ZLQ4_9FLAO|nr:hypothetical protein [Kordia antarctica]QHI36884.1 hypothetical protein IMCC3317_22540 [Kordia antarctica]